MLDKFRMIVMIYYQMMWMFRFAGFILPATGLLKLIFGLWILLPQCRGEFFIYEFGKEYLLQFERKISVFRCQAASYFVMKF